MTYLCTLVNEILHEETKQKKYVDRGLELDIVQCRVTVDGKEVHLCTKEFELLYIFITHKDRVLTRDFILESLWDIEKPFINRVVDICVNVIKRKLGNKIAKRFKHIANVGYMYQ